MKSAFVVMGSALLLGLSVSSGAYAQGAGAGGGRGGFTEQGGEAIFKNVCQGCHMPDAKGAVGAGMYPALAKNPKLEVAGYPVSVIVNGQKGVVGSHDKDVSDALGAAALSLPVEITVGTKMLDVTVGPSAGGTEAMVWLVTFKDHAQVQIDRGENAGQLIDYRQIVSGRQMLGMWDPATGTISSCR